MKTRRDYVTNSSSSSYVVFIHKDVDSDYIKNLLLPLVNNETFEEIVECIINEGFGKDYLSESLKETTDKTEIENIISQCLYEYILSMPKIHGDINGYSCYKKEIDSGNHSNIETFLIYTGTIGNAGISIVKL